MLDRMTEAEQMQRADPPPATSVLDRPEINAAGWLWGDEGAKAPPDAPLPGWSEPSPGARCKGSGPARLASV